MLKGHSVLFYRMSDFISLIEAKNPVAFSRFKERLRKIELLILDYVKTLISVKKYA